MTISLDYTFTHAHTICQCDVIAIVWVGSGWCVALHKGLLKIIMLNVGLMAGRYQFACAIDLLALLLAAVHLARSIPESEFYPFGSAAGDRVLQRSNEHSSPEIVLETQFTLFGRATNRIFVRRIHNHSLLATYN